MHYQIGLCYFNFLSVVLSIPNSFYSVNFEARSFEEAQISCKSDHSFLTNIPDHKETLKILKAIEDKKDNNSTSFWIGLQKNNLVCVDKKLPLKGFCWTVDNSTEFELNKWTKDPPSTCTAVLCGLLSVEYRGSQVVKWGLASSTCKQRFPFICKHEQKNEKKSCPMPHIRGTHDIMYKLNDPDTIEVSCNANESFTLTCSRSTSEWKVLGGTSTDIQELCQECQMGFKRVISGICVDINECEQPNICKQKCINSPGSYSCICFDQNEDSEICKNATTDSPFNSSAVVTNKNQDEPVTLENTGDMSKFLIPVIISLLIFVVLVVITVAIVKYCMMRHATKRAKRRAAVLKETVALNGSDSLEKVNEKETK